MTASDSQAEHFRKARELIADPAIRKYDALRLTALFALRYETDGAPRIAELKRDLETKGLGSADISLIDALLAYAGVRARMIRRTLSLLGSLSPLLMLSVCGYCSQNARRSSDLFASRSLLAKFTSTVKRSVAGVQNVFTQHTPLLHEVLQGA